MDSDLLKALKLATDLIEFEFIDFDEYGFKNDKDIIVYLRSVINSYEIRDSK